jgi:thymidine phosphorylase
LEKLAEIHRAPIIQPFLAKSSGKIKKMDAETIGRVSLLLGGGRKTSDDAIDFAVGLSAIKKIDERVEKDEPLLFVHARHDQTLRSVLPLLETAIAVER